MEIQEAIDFIKFVFEQVQEDLAFQRWVVRYQDEIDFDTFTAGLKAKTQATMSKEEIMDQTKEILDSMTRDNKWKSLNYSDQFS